MKNSINRLGNITIVGLKAISRNKLRSFLTALGIIIGVACVIAVVAIGNGATKSIENTINSLGTNYIMVFPGASTQSGARIFTGNSTMTADDAEGMKQDGPVVAPYPAVMKRLSGKTRIDMIQVSAASAGQIQEAQNQIEAYLRQRHRIQPGQDSDFQMRSQEEIAQAQSQQMSILRTLLLSIAAISLFVGGIGIMNIMLASVTERTREIGIRMALAAKRRDITMQFLIEAIVQTTIGGAVAVRSGREGAVSSPGTSHGGFRGSSRASV